MNRTLRRPMFRIGGTAEGITSGLQPRQGYAHEPGHVIPNDPSKLPNDPSKLPNDPSKYRDTGVSDFLINMGLDLVSRPRAGNIFQQIGTSAKEPFKQFQTARAAGEKRDWEMGLHKEKMDFERDRFAYEQKRDDLDRELQLYLGEIEAKGKTQWIVEELDKYWDEKIAAAPPSEQANLQALKAEERREVLRGYDVSDSIAILRNTVAFDKAQELARYELEATKNPNTKDFWTRNDPGYADAVIQLTNRYLRQFALFLKEDKDKERELDATGGRVGYQNAGAVGEGQNVLQGEGAAVQGETNQVNISYEQLRERLPPEISNEIVLLLSQSYEAFADFAEIQTQADVNEFNTKYNVQLFLPKQAGA